MASSAPSPTLRKQGALLLVFLFLVSVTSLAAQAADSDGDGVQDSADDCPWAAGDSTVDRDGCPDRDGDGTSDFNDAWAIGNPNFQNEFTTENGKLHGAVKGVMESTGMATARMGFRSGWINSSRTAAR